MSFFQISGCDLLSNCIFDVLKNNPGDLTVFKSKVVICFQIVSLTYWKTTGQGRRRCGIALWFAFKLYLWRIEKQRDGISQDTESSCDLLSNCIFDVLKNNCRAPPTHRTLVVICFQIVSLTYWKTTVQPRLFYHMSLWFAFKLYLWRIEKQPQKRHRSRHYGCDLLSNCIFDVLKNN